MTKELIHGGIRNRIKIATKKKGEVSGKYKLGEFLAKNPGLPQFHIGVFWVPEDMRICDAHFPPPSIPRPPASKIYKIKKFHFAINVRGG